MNSKGTHFLCVCISLTLTLVSSSSSQSSFSFSTFGTTPIGGACTSPADCVGFELENSDCVSDGLESKCICRGGFVPKADNSSCLDIVNMLGGKCQESQQCTSGIPGANSECTTSAADPPAGKVCQCKAGALTPPSTHECLLKTELGGACKHNIQCDWIEFGVCSGAKCACDTGHIAPPDVKDKCVTLASVIGGPCDEADNQCQGVPGSSCVGEEGLKTCVCNPTDQVPGDLNRICLDKQLLNGPCELIAQCSKVEYSSCIPSSSGSRCLCRQEYIESVENNGTLCLKTVSQLEGDCVENIQCLALHDAQCLTSKCRCPTDALTSGGKCYKKATQLWDHCWIDEQCSGPIANSACKNGQCQCLPGHLQSQDKRSCGKCDSPCAPEGPGGASGVGALSAFVILGLSALANTL